MTARRESVAPNPDPAHVLELAAALILLVIGATAGAVLEGVWLTQRIGPVAVPVTILAAAVGNGALVLVAARWSRSWAVRMVPVLAWLLTIVALDLGPGGDTIVPIGLRGLGLLVAGVVAPMWALAAVDARRARLH